MTGIVAAAYKTLRSPSEWQTRAGLTMLRLEMARDVDGRWLGEIPDLPGVMAYGATEAEVRTNTIALAFWVIGERIARGEPVPIDVHDYFAEA